MTNRVTAFSSGASKGGPARGVEHLVEVKEPHQGDSLGKSKLITAPATTVWHRRRPHASNTTVQRVLG